MAIFGNPKYQLSQDARHLLNVAQQKRDYAGIAFSGVGLSSVLLVNAVVVGLGVTPIGSAALLVSASAYAGMRALKGAKQIDQKLIESSVHFSEEVIPAQRGLLPMTKVADMIQQADRKVPSLVTLLAQRRVRCWETALDPEYRPPVKEDRKKKPSR